jgi:hypothetical protein
LPSASMTHLFLHWDKSLLTMSAFISSIFNISQSHSPLFDQQILTDCLLCTWTFLDSGATVIKHL